ncbi:MAG: hypothetical protein R3242_05470 [Akkermansiaceae bacterium]|nr:hypothetical protein [Akkermansiaceae bacterium]
MPTEPDRYDLDQMMDRLKQRSSDDPAEQGELVTRADGSKAIRVKRRKRRSRQPHKDRARRIRMLQVSALLVLGLLLLLLAGFLTIYVNTAAFREKLTRQIAASSGAKVELQQFRMNPVGANATGVDLLWPEGNLLARLSLRQLSADVSMFSSLDGGLAGEELEVRTAVLDLRLPEARQSKWHTTRAKGDLPVRFEDLSINQLEVRANAESSGSIRLVDSEALLEADGGQGHPILNLDHGKLIAKGWPTLRLKRGFMEFKGSKAEVLGLTLRHPDDDMGRLQLAGMLAPYSGEPTKLRVEAESFPLDGLLGEPMSKLVSGRVDTEPDASGNALIVNFGESAGASLVMDFEASPDEVFMIQRLPCLYALSQTLGDKWFSQPSFVGTVNGRILRDSQRIELRDLDCTSHGRMAIRGNLAVESGRLSGVLQLGVANGMIQSAQNPALQAMFGEPRGAYCWVEIELSGPAELPEDNFGALYEQASRQLGTSVGKPAESGRTDLGEGGGKEAGGQADEGSVFESLTRPR